MWAEWLCGKANKQTKKGFVLKPKRRTDFAVLVQMNHPKKIKWGKDEESWWTYEINLLIVPQNITDFKINIL